MRQTSGRLIRRFHASQTTGPMLLAIMVGLGAGLGAAAFRWLISTASRATFGAADVWLPGWGELRVVPVPAVGGLLVGLLVHFLAKEAKGHGVPEVMLAVARQGAVIRARVAVVKSLASAICIGSGGSAGREGPIVQIGSALGSTLGQLLQLSEERLRLLIACGAAGGIAATFNAPIGGALFAIEVIVRDFTTRSFGMVVLASVAATAVSRGMLGDAPAFRVPSHPAPPLQELPAYAILGIMAALVGLLFTRALYWTEDAADRIRIPEYVKPALGGVLIGLLGSRVPGIFGVGYTTIEPALGGKIAWDFCLTLVFLKIIATSLTIGSGGSGGVFAPSLFLGAALGSGFGQALHLLLPDLAANTTPYAIAGMGAVFAGAARAPLTSVIILFEMTADYRIILPLMAAAVVSALLSERLSHHDIYSLKLHRRGIDLHPRAERDPMTDVNVADVMTHDLDTVQATMSLEDLAREFRGSSHHGFPVVSGQGDLVGIITLSDLERAVPEGLHDRLVEDIMTRNVMVCYPEQTLRSALADPAAGEVGRLPVVDPETPHKLVGVLRRMDIIHAYTATAAGLPPDEHPQPPSVPSNSTET